MKILAQLWADEAGFVVSSELILISLIMVFGVLVGMQTVRDAVISELADVAQAINNLNQSYSFSAVTGHASSVAGSIYDDNTDFCDIGSDPADDFPACVGIDAASAE